MSNKFHSGTKLICIGEAMLELSLDNAGNASTRFAGDTLNTAVYLQRLCGDFAKISYCTVVGDDALSERMVNFIESEHIDVSSIDRISDSTIGLYAITTDLEGERSFTYWRSESAAKSLFQTDGKTDFGILRQYEVVYLSAITLAILAAPVRLELLEYLTALRNKQAITLAFDSNYRPALWESQSIARSTIESFWKITDIALPSIDDEQALFDEQDEKSVLSRFKSYGITQGVLKRGAVGPIGLCSDAITLSKNELTAVHPVDTTAAGDSFNAGYLSAILKGSTQREALLAGHECAARVITHHGAIVPISDW